MKKILLFLVVIIVCFACNSKKYSFEENPGVKIVFGEGGGFAGSLQKYSMFDNGQVFLQNGFDVANQVEKNSLKKKEIKKVLKELQSLNFSELEYNKSGNMYQFIELHQGDSMHKVQWPSGDKNIVAGVPELYKHLKTLVKESND